MQNEAALRSAAAASAGLELRARVLVSTRHGGVDMIAPTPGVGQGAAGPGDSNSSDGADSNAETGAGSQHRRSSKACWIHAAVRQRGEKGEV